MPTRKISERPLLAALKDTQVEFELGTTLGAIWNDVYETNGLINEIRLSALKNKVEDRSAKRSRYAAYKANEERRRILEEKTDQYSIETNENERQNLLQEIADLKSQQTPIEAWQDQMVSQGNFVSVEEQEERYKDIEFKADRPITEEELQERVKIRKEALMRDAIVSAGPEGASAFVAQTGTALLRAAIDPIAFASAFIPIVGQVRSAKLAAKYGKIKGRAIEGAMDGAGGAVLVEPLMLGISHSQQLDYTYSDSLLNVGAGLLLGSGIGSIAGRLSRRAERRQEQVKIDLELIADAYGDKPEAPTVTVKNTHGPSEYVGNNKKLAVKMKEMAEIAISLAAVGKRIDLSFLGPALPDRPPTLTEFIRSMGGIQDVKYAQNVVTKLENKTKLRGVSILNKDSKYTMEVMANLAYEQGYIKTNSVRALAGALTKESKGKYQFREKDAGKAAEYINSSGVKSFDEALDLEIGLIKQDAENIGLKITDEQAYAIAEMRSKGLVIDDAYKQLGIDTKQYRAKAAAKYANDPDNDIEASEPNEFPPDNVPDDETALALEDVQRDQEYLNNLPDEEKAKLSDEQKADLAEIEEMDAHSNDTVETVKNAKACVMGKL